MKVYPSGAAWATRTPAVMPAPPPIFSTMTVCPRISPIACAWSRAEMSTPPPGVNGTTSVMVRVGQSCAPAGESVARARRNPKTMRDIAFSIVLGDIISAPLIRCHRPAWDTRAGRPPLVHRFHGTNHIDIIHQPRPEERALARVSKDGHLRDRARGHPSRRPREERGLLRMRSGKRNPRLRGGAGRYLPPGTTTWPLTPKPPSGVSKISTNRFLAGSGGSFIAPRTT